MLKWGCKAVDVPHGGSINYVVGRLVGAVADTAQGVGGIVGVQPIGQARLLSLPMIRVSKDDGTQASFSVVHSPTTPNLSSKNNIARDNLVAAV